MNRHACSNPRCDVLIPIAHLACKSCWYALPPRLRAAIAVTYKEGPRRAYSDNVLQARQFWTANKEAER